ncbi:hypothetical protein [Catenuloplanes indicus]|uniref:Transmembrane protein n=1 Tax=Catenuloplanes indicus TaxID=137267 RepID=A0AAE3W6B1_9ACTN|nr:hypothetical protein [Catenuloplanes indicus]MDQ0370708.1 hypothetical protein [Catenuloplanes indicus]
MTVPQHATRDPRTAPGLVVPIAGPVRHGRRRAAKLAGFALLAVGALALLVALPWLGMGPGVAEAQPGLVRVEHPLLYAAGGAVAVACAIVVIRRTRRA